MHTHDTGSKPTSSALLHGRQPLPVTGAYGRLGYENSFRYGYDYTIVLVLNYLHKTKSSPLLA